MCYVFCTGYILNLLETWYRAILMEKRKPENLDFPLCLLGK